MRIALLTTHLTGSGHLVRMAALARAGQAAGHRVRVLNGGMPLAHLPLRDLSVGQLPPLMVRDLDYGTLRDASGHPASAGYMHARCAQIEAELEAFAPDVLVTETYPLGRRALAGEFRAALSATGALAVASVRDIPEPKPHRVAEASETLRRDFAALLVHGTEDVIPLSASWPLEGVDHLIHHTGYVAEGAEVEPIPGGVLVSVGGGTLGRALLPVAAEAARRSAQRWRILVGGSDAASVKLPPARNLTVEPARPDYRALLAGAACSISLCGYNTALDLAACETPAILVPMTDRGEREQEIRARHMAAFEGITCLTGDEATPGRLASLVDAIAGQRRPRLPLTTDGAARSIAILEGLMTRP
ncbi:glycosyltransferase [Rhodobacteraceae bacterium NNCM2]|nr:glycosyltransferase [Coraliihabitans acroporae]